MVSGDIGSSDSLIWTIQVSSALNSLFSAQVMFYNIQLK